MFEFRDGHADVLDSVPMHNPTHPGEFIREVFLEPNGITGRQLAAKLGVSPPLRSTVCSSVLAVLARKWPGWSKYRVPPDKADEIDRRLPAHSFMQNIEDWFLSPLPIEQEL